MAALVTSSFGKHRRTCEGDGPQDQLEQIGQRLENLRKELPDSARFISFAFGVSKRVVEVAKEP